MITVDSDSPVQVAEQIRLQIVQQIRSGELDAGHRLPSIRQLAADLRVAPRTVARVYSALEADGFVETNRSAGTRVRGGHRYTAALTDAARLFVSAAKREDSVDLADVLGAVRAAWDTAG